MSYVTFAVLALVNLALGYAGAWFTERKIVPEFKRIKGSPMASILLTFLFSAIVITKDTTYNIFSLTIPSDYVFLCIFSFGLLGYYIAGKTIKPLPQTVKDTSQTSQPPEQL
ncbi:hypothetical protein COX05_01405 [candidate division WWE3 bacterium CG22_combo_CG10-13_8_21_14_all_39_12]|uniref:Uncharacterized protein n=2 Tax=Katanobacteria TaxID=422282 RepID=A0A2M7X4E0_UNCKA|nr:MAG: hypothetical protein COX05_01405 [candidate division WWE3 bacterium CG22_combo_CG10-13_8_21_14_all_39_12]PJA41007.1 MAG: hypothetical protein CO179_00875 [candidate division WWE3 bacterium CG_4_9_14_3_um_filter_39_7]